MQKLFTTITFIIIIIAINFISSSFSPVFASGEFASDYNVSYDVQDNGPTLVQQNITLTNLQTNLYVTESEITVGTTNINNVSASDSEGNLALKLSQDQDSTKIHVFFNQKVVGKGKSLNWVLKYQSNNVVTKVGLIKEINVPRLELDADIDSYNLTVNVPRSWGKPAYVKPVYKEFLNFNKDELAQGQISIAYGPYQVFDFKLNYHLKNSRLTPILTEIALPPDTNYQKVYLNTLIPQPLDVVVDKDGNWLAKYSLTPGQILNVVATGSAQLYLTPFNQKDDFHTSQYLSNQKYWETASPQIQQLAQKYKTPRAIYNYVVSKLKYNYAKVNQNPARLGALAALLSPDQAICMEFTDLFIAIARAAGIPAREVDGFAFTTNQRLRPLSLQKDILHAWPEYYDGEKWIQIDPTWQNTTGGVDFFTTFDFNHLAFVIKGQDSEYPYPAGSYKIDDQDTKDVDVQADKTLTIPNNNSNLSMELVFPDNSIAGFGIDGKLILNNSGPTLISDQTVTLSSFGAKVSTLSIATGIIPPYGKKEFALSLSRTAWYLKTRIILSAKLNGRETKSTIEVKPVIFIYLLPVILVLTLIGCAGFLKFKRKK